MTKKGIVNLPVNFSPIVISWSIFHYLINCPLFDQLSAFAYWLPYSPTAQCVAMQCVCCLAQVELAVRWTPNASGQVTHYLSHLSFSVWYFVPPPFSSQYFVSFVLCASYFFPSSPPQIPTCGIGSPLLRLQLMANGTFGGTRNSLPSGIARSGRLAGGSVWTDTGLDSLPGPIESWARIRTV